MLNSENNILLTSAVSPNAQKEWILRSEKGSGDRSDPDPLESTCVKYGDVIYMQVNVASHRWLNGLRDSNGEGVYTRNIYAEPVFESVYRWKVRSTPGTGLLSSPDPKQGDCLHRNDVIYLQVNDNRWLSGSRNGDGQLVITRNHLDGGYEQGRPFSYEWVVQRELGESMESTSKRDEFGQLASVNGAYVFKSYNELQGAYDTCKAEANTDNAADPDAEKLYEAHKECLADEFNGPIGHSLELVFGVDASPGFICGVKDAVVNNNKELPGFCCLDAPFQLPDAYWGHEVRILTKNQCKMMCLSTEPY